MSEELFTEEEAKTLYSELTNPKLELKYGENPWQKAYLYGNNTSDYDVYSGQMLSYNDFLNINEACKIASEFYDVCAAVSVKNVMPCGAALPPDIEEAFEKALDCDPVGAFGSTFAFTQKVDEKFAQKLSQMYFNAVIAPDFSEEAIEILKKSSNLKIIRLNTPLKEFSKFTTKDVKLTPLGVLVRESHSKDFAKDTFKVVSKKKPNKEQVEDMIFAIKIVKHARSNAAVIAKDFKTSAIAQGFTNFADATEYALNKSCEQSKDAILALDGDLSAESIVKAAVQGRIGGIILPNITNADVILTADKYELVVITTGIRELKH